MPPRRLLTTAVIIAAIITAAAWPAAAAAAAASPFVLAPGQGLYEQFGYAPAYTRNVPAFDAAGRAYIRSRTSSGNATSYVQTLEAGSWVRLGFLAALRAAYPEFAGTVGAGSFRSDRLVFDRQDRAYNPVTVRLRDGTTRNALLVSWDLCRTWKVFKLPQGTFTTEHWVGHNEIDGPPFLAIWRTSGPPDVPGSQRNFLYVTQPRLDGEHLVIPPLVKVTDQCLGLSRDSGGASFAGTRGTKTWFVWSEAAPKGKGGTPHYISSYDHRTGKLGPRRKIATSPQRSDPHNKPGICLDTAGYLHVVAGGHGTPVLYTRSLAPLTSNAGWTTPLPVLASGWASSTDPTASQRGRQTYPSFVCDGDDTLHLITRQWRRGVDPYFDGQAYAALVHQSCPAGGAWSKPTVIVVAAYARYGVFFHKIALDARDRLFVSCSYQGGPELQEERARGSMLELLGRVQLRPGKYRGRMLLVSDDGGRAWRFAGDADLAPAGEAPAAAAARAARPKAGTPLAQPPLLSWRWLNPRPLGNQVTSVTFSGARHGWAVGTHGLIRGTTNGGVRWIHQDAPSATDLFGVAAASPKRAWAVGADGTILRTTDGGVTWRAVASGTTRDLFSICAVDSRELWAVGERGTILHSTNAGRTWARRTAPQAETLFSVSFVNRRVGLLCGSKGVLFRTLDRGAHWKRRPSSASSALFSVRWLDKKHVVAVGKDGHVITSDNGGWTWRVRRTGTTLALRNVALAAGGRTIWALGPSSVLRSTDGGRRWKATRLPVPGPCGALVRLGKAKLVVGGAGGAICRSRDAGKTWQVWGSGARDAFSALAASDGDVWMAGARGTFVSAPAGGGQWSSVTLAGRKNLSGLARRGSRGWTVGDGGAMATSWDGGATWHTVPPITKEGLTAVAAPSEQSVVVAGLGGTLATSSDAGATWTRATVIADDVLCLDFLDAQHGWAGGGAGFGETRAEIAGTTDGGLTWQAMDLPVWGRVHGLCFLDDETGWAVVEDWGIDGDRPQGAIMATADGGATWVRQATTANVLLGVQVDAGGTGCAWGEGGRVVRTADAGATWEQVDVGTDSALRAGAAVGDELWLAGDGGAVIVGGAPAAP